MSDKRPAIGIVFFANVLASVSHELKNRIAIIKEQAGLLKDYSTMALQGREINMERLGKLGRALSEQVDMTDNILKNMNRFAHSADDLICSADLNEILRLVAMLAKRPANQHRIDLIAEQSDSPVAVKTAPFFLMNLIWLILSAFFQPDSEPRSIVLRSEPAGNGGGCIHLQINASEESIKSPTAVPPEVLSLSAAIAATVDWNLTEHEIRIDLPAEVLDPSRLHEL